MTAWSIDPDDISGAHPLSCAVWTTVSDPCDCGADERPTTADLLDRLYPVPAPLHAEEAS